MAYRNNQKGHQIIGHGADHKKNISFNMKLNIPSLKGINASPYLAHMSAGKTKSTSNNKHDIIDIMEKYLEELIETIKEFFSSSNKEKLTINLKFPLTEQHKEALRKHFANIEFSADNKKLTVYRNPSTKKTSIREKPEEVQYKPLPEDNLPDVIEELILLGYTELPPGYALTEDELNTLKKIFNDNIDLAVDDNGIINIMTIKEDIPINEDAYNDFMAKYTVSDEDLEELLSELEEEEEIIEEVPKEEKKSETKPKEVRKPKAPSKPPKPVKNILEEISEFPESITESMSKVFNIPTELKAPLKKPKTAKIKPPVKKAKKEKKVKVRPKATKPTAEPITIKFNRTELTIIPLNPEDVLNQRISHKKASLYGFIVPVKRGELVRDPIYTSASAQSYYFDETSGRVLQYLGWRLIGIKKQGKQTLYQMIQPPSQTESATKLKTGVLRRVPLVYVPKFHISKRIYGYNYKGQSVDVNPGDYHIKIIRGNLLLVPVNKNWKPENIIIIPKRLIRMITIFNKR